MNTISHSSDSAKREQFEAFLSSPQAQEMAQRFVEGFVPMMDAKIEKAVQTVVAEEFPALADDEAFMKRVMARLTPDVVEEQRFVFLAKNPKFPAAKA